MNEPEFKIDVPERDVFADFFNSHRIPARPWHKHKSPMSKAQKKARAKSKAARIARRKNR